MTMDGVGADDLQVGLLRVDAQDRVLAANAAFRAWTTVREPVGRLLSELFVSAPDFLDDQGVTPQMMVDSGDPQRAALVARTEFGDGSMVTVFDMTTRYRAGRRLRASMSLAERTRRRLELVIESSIAFADAKSEGRLAEILAVTTAQAYRAEESLVLLSDGDGMRPAAGSNPLAPEFGVAAFADLATNLHRVLRVSDEVEAGVISPALVEGMRRSGVQALIAAPIEHEGPVLGLFVCFFHHPREFDDEAAPLAEALSGQAGQVLTAVRLRARLEHAATHDETTGLPNRRMLEERPLAADGPHEVAVVFVDMDGFKLVNDRLGHDAGDDVLREVARRLVAATRDDDIVVRYGGDEFVVICDAAGEEAAAEIAERIRLAVSAPYPWLPEDLAPAASVGVATGVLFDGISPIDRLIREADQAMYRAKNVGGNRVVAAG